MMDSSIFGSEVTLEGIVIVKRGYCRELPLSQQWRGGGRLGPEKEGQRPNASQFLTGIVFWPGFLVAYFCGLALMHLG